MQKADEQASGEGCHDVVRDVERVRHGDGRDELPGLLGIGCGIRPGIAVPRTVLLCDMGDGALYLPSWRQGPSAYLTPDDAVPLRRELGRVP